MSLHYFGLHLGIADPRRTSGCKRLTGEDNSNTLLLLKLLQLFLERFDLGEMVSCDDDGISDRVGLTSSALPMVIFKLMR